MSRDPRPYSFPTQLSRGAQGEAVLDAHFGTHWDITPASPSEQQRGIDRWFVHRAGSSTRVAVEYKTDRTAGRTQNAFIETISVDTAGKRGWAYTSAARSMVYYVPSCEQAYVIPFKALRRALPRWTARYPQRRIPNEGYHTQGLLVPLAELAGTALAVVNVSGLACSGHRPLAGIPAGRVVHAGAER